jgi:hypothetical protein
VTQEMVLPVLDGNWLLSLEWNSMVLLHLQAPHTTKPASMLYPDQGAAELPQERVPQTSTRPGIWWYNALDQDAIHKLKSGPLAGQNAAHNRTLLMSG